MDLSLIHISRICDLLIEQGRLSEEQKNAVMKREKLVSTEISPFAALPHCLIDGESFFVFVLMKNPVPWGKANVRLVILGCFKSCLLYTSLWFKINNFIY